MGVELDPAKIESERDVTWAARPVAVESAE
jgi:hypothetical protein